MSEQQLPMLRVRPDQLADRALVVGDPQRAEAAAGMLEGADQIGAFREYVTFRGRHRGVPIIVCSHGVGSAGAALAFHELFQGGVTTVIRAGTCGALRADIDDGSLIVGTGAIREDGTSERLVPLAYPALAHHAAIRALTQACGQRGGADPVAGIIYTSAVFYPGLLAPTTRLWMDAGAVAVEMEFACLLVMAALRGLRAGGIFTSDGNLAREATPEIQDNAYDPHRRVVQAGVERMLGVALDALAAL